MSAASRVRNMGTKAQPSVLLKTFADLQPKYCRSHFLEIWVNTSPCGDGIVSPKRYVPVLTSPVCVSLFGEMSLCRCCQSKMQSHWFRVGLTSTTGVLMREEEGGGRGGALL